MLGAPAERQGCLCCFLKSGTLHRLDALVVLRECVVRLPGWQKALGWCEGSRHPKTF